VKVAHLVQLVVNADSVFGAFDVLALVDAPDIALFQRSLKQEVGGIELVTAVISDRPEIAIEH